jgi:hypothetical protein
MKKLVLLSALLLAVQAQAHTIDEVCSLIATYSASSGTQCIKAISSGAHFDASATDNCYTLASYSIDNGLKCVKAIAGNFYDKDATAACAFINTYSYTEGLNCIVAVANKSYPNNTAKLCQKVAQTSISEGTRCLAENGVAMGKVCPSLADISTQLGSAMDAIFNGTPRVAIQILQDTKSKIDSCLSPTQPN